jgi:circadian clock protein KaiC
MNPQEMRLGETYTSRKDRLQQVERRPLEAAEALAAHFFKDMGHYYPFHNTWEGHVSNICDNVQKLITETGLELTDRQWGVLLGAILLHDIGKVLPELHPEIGKTPPPSPLVAGKLEKVHHVLGFHCLAQLGESPGSQRRRHSKATPPGRPAQPWETNTVRGLRGSLGDSEYLECIAWMTLLHKVVEDDDLTRFEETLAGKAAQPRGALQRWAGIDKIRARFTERKNRRFATLEKWLGAGPQWTRAGGRRTFSPASATGTGQETDSPDTLSVLSALLNCGDRLDITCQRLDLARFYCAVLLDELGAPETEIDLPHADAMARWFQFMYTDRVDICGPVLPASDEIPTPKATNGDSRPGLKPEPHTTKIVIRYSYPRSLSRDFVFFRYQAEKDFEDLGILRVLQAEARKQREDPEYRIEIYRSEELRDDPTTSPYRTQTQPGGTARGSNSEGGERGAEAGQPAVAPGAPPAPTPNAAPEERILVTSANKRTLWALGKFCTLVRTRVDHQGLDAWLAKILPGCVMPCLSKDGKGPTGQTCRLLADVLAHCRAKNMPDAEIARVLDAVGESQPPAVFKGGRRRARPTGWACLSNLSAATNRCELSPRARKGLDRWKRDARASREAAPRVGDGLFAELPGRPAVPVCMDLLHLLSLFGHSAGEWLSIDDVVQSAGLDRGRAEMYCGRLESKEILELNTATREYRLQGAKRKLVASVLEPFHRYPSEYVAKARDVERFGKPLALSSDIQNERLCTGIEGLDGLLAAPGSKMAGGLPKRKVILIAGPPGSGKTTLALEMVKNIARRSPRQETALYLTFEDDVPKLTEDYRAFGWEPEEMAECVRSLSSLRRNATRSDPDRFLKGIIDTLDECAPDFVAIDNLGYVLQRADSVTAREILVRLIRILTVRGITAVLLGEATKDDPGFEAYDVDGIIVLRQKQGRRVLEVTKMRGCLVASGEHAFDFGDDDLFEGVETDRHVKARVYPNIGYYMSRSRPAKKPDPESSSGEKTGGETPKKRLALKFGIKGLDELLPIADGDGTDHGFDSGEAVLVLGSPGAGKTLLGLHFLREGFRSPDPERLIWISFESRLGGLLQATRGFGNENPFDDLLKAMEANTAAEEDGKPSVRFRFCAPARLEPNRFINGLLELCDGPKREESKTPESDDKLPAPRGRRPVRLVLDSITDLEQSFASEAELKMFMTSLVQILRDREITPVFLYRAREFFGKTEDIGRAVASVVDVIICLKILEIQNAIQKGLFLLKVRGREHRSRLLALTFEEKEGIRVEDRGWTMSGLISGEAGEIHEPSVSVKLFFENANERLINRLMVDEYNRRFLGRPTYFVSAMKPQIYSEFWSFRGSSGAGHANVRVVSLCDYWAALFHRQTKLYDLMIYLSSDTKALIRNDPFWKRCALYRAHRYEVYSLPSYVDIGVLAFHRRLRKLRSFWEWIGGTSEELSTVAEVQRRLRTITWDQLASGEPAAVLKEIAENFEREEKRRAERAGRKVGQFGEGVSRDVHAGGRGTRSESAATEERGEVSKPGATKEPENPLPPRYLFAMPGLGDKAAFVSFFLEVLWSYGGVLLDLRGIFNMYASSCLRALKVGSSEKLYPVLGHRTGPPVPATKFELLAELLLLMPERIVRTAVRNRRMEEADVIEDLGKAVRPWLPIDDAGARPKRDPESPKDVGSGDQATVKLTIVEALEECIVRIGDELRRDPVWQPKCTALRRALARVKEELKGLPRDGENALMPIEFAIAAYEMMTCSISNRQRYFNLLDWYRLTVKEEAGKDEVIHLKERDACGRKTLELLANLVNKRIAPNPRAGSLADQAYLARCWSGDVAYPPRVRKKINDLVEEEQRLLTVYQGAKAEGRQAYHVAPLPAIDRPGNKKRPPGRWSYAVLGVWNLGIVKPAVSPEIGWIFIDAITEDRLVDLRARMGCGLPAKTEAYGRASYRFDQPDMYGAAGTDSEDEDAEAMRSTDEKGVVELYHIPDRSEVYGEPSGHPSRGFGALAETGRRGPAQSSGSTGHAGVDPSCHYITRERASIPQYYKIEMILGTELARLFEPGFLQALRLAQERARLGVPLTKNEATVDSLLDSILKRIKERIGDHLWDKDSWKGSDVVVQIQGESESGSEPVDTPQAAAAGRK